jgi:hypothetical protein
LNDKDTDDQFFHMSRSFPVFVLAFVNFHFLFSMNIF